jgi:hypothetical protein
VIGLYYRSISLKGETGGQPVALLAT